MYSEEENDVSEVSKKTILEKGIYQHFKGNSYEVIDIARHSENQQEYVIYRALYGDRGLWVRPLVMFVETIERDGQLIKRFCWLRDVE